MWFASRAALRNELGSVSPEDVRSRTSAAFDEFEGAGMQANLVAAQTEIDSATLTRDTDSQLLRGEGAVASPAFSAGFRRHFGVPLSLSLCATG